MSKPMEHANNSAKQFGGKASDYVAIHDLMDSTKACIADHRHRAATHNSWFIGPGGPLELAFGKVIINSDGNEVSVREIGEQHIVEDFGFIPSLQDWMMSMNYEPWMNNGKGGYPPSLQGFDFETPPNTPQPTSQPQQPLAPSFPPKVAPNPGPLGPRVPQSLVDDAKNMVLDGASRYRDRGSRGGILPSPDEIRID